MLTSLYIDGFRIYPESAIAQPGRVGILSATGFGSPQPRVESYDRPRAHGAAVRTQFYGTRYIDLVGRIIADTDSAAITTLDLLKAAFSLDDGDADKTLLFRRAGMSVDEYASVRVASAFEWDMPLSRHQYIMWAVQLSAADPRFYSNTLQTSTSSGTLSGGGLEFPLVFPLVFEDTGTSGLSITNGGNFLTPPVLLAGGPVVNPVFRNATRDKEISVDVTLGSSDVLRVDVSAREVKLNGTVRNDLVDVANTEWWELAAGVNSLRLIGSGMTAGTTYMTCQWRDARI